MELALQVISTEELRRTVSRFRPAPRNQVEGSGKRVARRVAHLHPFGARSATAYKRRRKAGDNRKSEPQSRLVTVLRTHWRGVSAQRSPRFYCGRSLEQSIGEKKRKSTSEAPVGQKDSQLARPDQCRSIASNRRDEGVVQQKKPSHHRCNNCKQLVAWRGRS